MSPPVIEMFRRKHFTDKKDFREPIEFEFGEQIQIRNVHHDCRNPKNEIDRLGRHKFDQFRGEHRQLLGHDYPRRPLGNAHAKFQCVSVEINGGEAAHNFCAVERKSLKCPINEVNRVSMIERDALRNAR